VLARQIFNFQAKAAYPPVRPVGTQKVLPSVDDNLTSGTIGKVRWKRGRRMPLR